VGLYITLREVLWKPRNSPAIVAADWIETFFVTLNSVAVANVLHTRDQHAVVLDVKILISKRFANSAVATSSGISWLAE